MASINEHENKMTVFYKKENGNIDKVFIGIQDMNVYGQYKDVFSMVFDFIVTNYDSYVQNHMEMFYVDTETKQLKLKSELVQNYL